MPNFQRREFFWNLGFRTLCVTENVTLFLLSHNQDAPHISNFPPT